MVYRRKFEDGKRKDTCGYDEDSNSYEYEMIFERQHPPFGEVVDYTENADGTFKYLYNSIEQRELEVPSMGE